MANLKHHNTDGTGKHPSQRLWQDLIAEFVEFGGLATNVRCQPCQHGLGLFPIDTLKPVCIRVPPALLIDTSKLTIRNGYPELLPEDSVARHHRQWFNRYQKYFGWTPETCQKIDTFERSLRQIPKSSRHILQTMGLLNLEHRHAESWNEIIFKQYLRTRSLLYRGQRVLMPIADLINHSPLANPYSTTLGVQVQGVFSNEVLVRYNETDPLRRFFDYGFANPEPMAYSYPLVVAMDRKERQQAMPPIVQKDSKSNDRIIDHEHHQQMQPGQRVEAISLHQDLAGPAHGTWRYSSGDFEDLYNDVRLMNQHHLQNLLESLSQWHHPFATSLREAIRFQIDALDRRIRVFVH